MSAAATVRFDVAVVGAGPAGATAALVLARTGRSCLLVDRLPATARDDKPGETLPPAINPLLRSLGLYNAFLQTSPVPCYGDRSAWGYGGPRSRDFIANPYGNGWHVDRSAFDQMLREAARVAGARLVQGASLTSVDRADGHWRLALRSADGRLSIEVGTVIDASGRAAAFARRLGVRRLHADRLVGVVAFLLPGAEPLCDATTLVEARPDGWWYSALLPDGRLSIGCFGDAELLAERQAWQAEAFLRLLKETVLTRERVRTGGFRLVAPPRVVAAGTSRLATIAGEGWIAVGDAAAAYDPLSSHGIGSAIWGGQAAANSLIEGSAGAARRYAETVARAYEQCLALGRAVYGAESRWPEAPFWRRRAAPAD